MGALVFDGLFRQVRQTCANGFDTRIVAGANVIIFRQNVW